MLFNNRKESTFIMDNKLFRKSALDKISSPEQLNEHMKVAGPGVWCIIGGLVLTFAAFFLWGIFGSIPETVDITGVALSVDGQPLAIYCFVPIEYSNLIEPGMNARVSPDYAPRERYGYIYSRVKSEGVMPVNLDELRESFGTDFDLLDIPNGNVIEIIIELDRVLDEPFWSTFRGDSINVIIGSTCLVTIITAERRPIELMFR